MLESMKRNVPDVTMLALFNDDGSSGTSRLDGIVSVDSVFAVRNEPGQAVDLTLDCDGNQIRLTDVR